MSAVSLTAQPNHENALPSPVPTLPRADTVAWDHSWRARSKEVTSCMFLLPVTPALRCMRCILTNFTASSTISRCWVQNFDLRQPVSKRAQLINGSKPCEPS